MSSEEGVYHSFESSHGRCFKSQHEEKLSRAVCDVNPVESTFCSRLRITESLQEVGLLQAEGDVAKSSCRIKANGRPQHPQSNDYGCCVFVEFLERRRLAPRRDVTVLGTQ